ncbi:MAG: hypothetical protein HKN87_01015 [Saprospiraceae bacterium]|nr:hypothetical protein [Saprospiraceae bacterium]
MALKKSLIIKLHLYCGLFTCFYLLALGASSLILNHGLQVEQNAIKSSWQGTIAVDKNLDDQQLAESAREQLGMMGWLPRWKYQRDTDKFQFETTHLAKTNRVILDLNSGRAHVDVMPKGFLATFHGLHFFNGRIPNAPFFLKTWIVYQWLGLLVLLASLILGLWLWLRYSHKTWELYVFGGLFILSILIMNWI